jgi:hypothetical protein
MVSSAAAAVLSACVRARVAVTARLLLPPYLVARQSMLQCGCFSAVHFPLVYVQVLESSREAGEPLSFEIGAGDITGNPLFQVGPDSAAADHFACLLTWLGYNPSTLPVNG